MRYITPKSPDPKTFGERLQYARYLHGLSQTGLAKASGVPRGSITVYEKETSEPGAYNLILLCKTLRVSADYLLGLKDDLR